MSTVQPGLEAVVRQQLEALLDRLRPAPLAEEMADLLMASIPELVRADDEDFRAGLLLSCESNVSAIWSRVLAGASLESIAPPAEAIAWSHELVHRGVELPALLRAYRLGHGLAERRLAEAAASSRSSRRSAGGCSHTISHHLFAYVDAVCTDLVDDYEHERAQWIRGAAAARAELVNAIVERRPVDPQAAIEKLRYDVTRGHVALIVWGDPPRAGQQAGSLEREATALAAALGGGPVLTVPIGERAVWAWTSGDHLTDNPAAVAHTMGEGVRAAIGTCREGLAGMADSHDEARVARRVAELRAIRPGTVVGYRAADLTALLTADPVEAVRFAESELGELRRGQRHGRPAQGDGPRLSRGEPQPGASRSSPRDPPEHRRVPGQADRGAARTDDRAAAPAPGGGVAAVGHDRRPAQPPPTARTPGRAGSHAFRRERAQRAQQGALCPRTLGIPPGTGACCHGGAAPPLG